MKQIIIVIGLGVTVLLSSMIVLSIQSKAERKQELTRAVSAAVKQTVSHSQIENQAEITSNDEMIAHFIQLLLSNMSSDGDIEVEVMGVDYEEGLLDVSITEKYKYLNGNDGKINVRKCAISQ